MNYYEPRPLQDGSGWHYTRTNDGLTFPVGYCSPYRTCPDCAGQSFHNGSCATCRSTGRVPVEDYAHVHSSADEAVDCFTRFLLDGIRWTDLEPGSVCRWKGCDEPTTRAFTVPIFGQITPVCRKHSTSVCVAELVGRPERVVSSF